jgi:hypothetical protein
MSDNLANYTTDLTEILNASGTNCLGGPNPILGGLGANAVLPFAGPTDVEQVIRIILYGSITGLTGADTAEIDMHISGSTVFKFTSLPNGPFAITFDFTCFPVVVTNPSGSGVAVGSGAAVFNGVPQPVAFKFSYNPLSTVTFNPCANGSGVSGSIIIDQASAFLL